MMTNRRLIISYMWVVAIVILSIRQFYALIVTSSLSSRLISSTYPADVTLPLENKKKIRTNENNKSLYNSSNQFSTLSTSNPITTIASNTDNIPIRRWGCNITLSPFIFVHIGKAGGGSVRARIAASAVNYARGELWQKSGVDSHYYPIPNQQDTSANSYHKGKFCTSKYPHFRPIEQTAFEGVSICHATTPIGQMIGCPMRKANVQQCYCNHNSNRCDLIYVGHNFIGSELHWLPGPYLEDWWNNNTMMRTSSLTRQDLQYRNFANDDTNDSSMEIQKYLRELSTGRLLTKQTKNNRAEKNVSSCYLPSRSRSHITTTNTTIMPGGNKNVHLVRSIPVAFKPDEEFHAQCLNQFVKKGDQLGRNWYHTHNIDGSKYLDNKKQQERQREKELQAPISLKEEDWSSLYASLPVARVTVLRDPFSWLLSKFFWSDMYYDYEVRCDDIQFGTFGSVANHDRDNNRNKSPYIEEAATSTLLQHHDQLSVLKLKTNELDQGKGWIVKFTLGYMLSLCGEDCVSRLHYGTMSLEAIYKQAKHNLYTSFAVVGILNETNTFYDMVSARMSYIDMKLNPHVEGPAHISERNSTETLRCKKQFLTNTTFQLELLRNSPEVQFLQNLYHDAIQVNRFQQEEMKNVCKVKFNDKNNDGMDDVGSNPTRGTVSNKTPALPKIALSTLERRKQTIEDKQVEFHERNHMGGKKVMILNRASKKSVLIDENKQGE